MNIDYFNAVDKRMYNHSVYPTKACYLHYELDHLGGDLYTVGNWSLYLFDETIEGKGTCELKQVLESLVTRYELQVYSKHKKDIIIIYTDNIECIRGNFKEFVTEHLDKYYVQILNHFEFRDLTKWVDDNDFDNSMKIMNEFYSEFEHYNYAYLTPSQQNRKLIKKALENEENHMPLVASKYEFIRNAQQSGVLNCVYTAGLDDRANKMIHADIVSAYIHSFLFEKHCCSKTSKVNPNTYTFYLNNDDYGSIGEYEIEYEYILDDNALRCFRDINGEILLPGHHKVDIILTNIDLQLLLDMKNFHIRNKITCNMLVDFKLDYLPQNFRNYIIDRVIDKFESKGDKTRYTAAKIRLNSIFGNLLLKVIDGLEGEEKYYAYKEYAKTNKTLPHWGVFTMAYTRRAVYNIGTKVTYWRYSDTDSIFCYDQDRNIKVIENYNDEIRKHNKEIYDKLQYEDERILELGTFEIEHITDMRIYGNKSYAYKDEDGKVIFKSSGCKPSEYNKLNYMKADFKPRAGIRYIEKVDDMGYHRKETEVIDRNIFEVLL